MPFMRHKEKIVSTFVPLYEQTMFWMKNKIILLIAGSVLMLLSSCLGSNEWESYYEVDKNIQIKTFSLKSDSVSALSSVAFTIDQLNCRIMNLDSMEYGTVVDKVLCTMTYGSYVSTIKVISLATGDTTTYSSTDTLDISKALKILVYANDGTTVRSYSAQVNVHQVVPDSMTWHPYGKASLALAQDDQKVISVDDTYYMYSHNSAGYHLYTADNVMSQWTEQSLGGLPSSGLKLHQLARFNENLYLAASDGSLYRSADGANWSKIANAPKVKAVLGGMAAHTNQQARLALLVNDQNTVKYAVMDADGEFTVGNAISAQFPVDGFAAQPLYLMYKDRVVVVGGKDDNGNLLSTTWSTLDGLNWAKQTDELLGAKMFTAREGASFVYYDSQYYLIGGFNAAGEPLKDIYRSSDYGVTWTLADELVILPEAYQARGYASLLVDSDKFLTIIGGKSTIGGQILDANWRGRINRLGFDRQ